MEINVIRLIVLFCIGGVLGWMQLTRVMDIVSHVTRVLDSS